ncbi:hypothetical protein PAHAL_9G549400 [Panicum hallii]|uniref:Uncharacterized protein n=1 Tax=Panicum hallii TaxID=206008 RepID=A0A2T8I5S8_9POAL|nr:hypothetical protein PAHAL_9G549400 [Panicum hallii]
MKICHDRRAFIRKAYFYLAIVSSEHARPNPMILARFLRCRPTKSKKAGRHSFGYPHIVTARVPFSTPHSLVNFADERICRWEKMAAKCQRTDRLGYDMKPFQ